MLHSFQHVNVFPYTKEENMVLNDLKFTTTSDFFISTDMLENTEVNSWSKRQMQKKGHPKLCRASAGASISIPKATRSKHSQRKCANKKRMNGMNRRKMSATSSTSSIASSGVRDSASSGVRDSQERPPSVYSTDSDERSVFYHCSSSSSEEIMVHEYDESVNKNAEVVKRHKKIAISRDEIIQAEKARTYSLPEHSLETNLHMATGNMLKLMVSPYCGNGLVFDQHMGKSSTLPNLQRKEINTEVEIQCQNGEKRVLRSTCDWAETAINGDHLWCPTSASGDMCYVGEENCVKSGPRMKCSACKIISHTHCISVLIDKVNFPCKPTFRDVGPRQYRTETVTHHHWVHRRNQKGKCKMCSRGFPSKMLFGSKEIVAISCSWCKAAYHNRESCFNIDRIEETCSLGLHAPIIVPPSWIVKLPRRGSFKSSLRKSPKKRSSSKKKDDKPQKPFAIKPIPTTHVNPLIVFINPKSGGNQGAKLMQKFQWLLNPRQVFDLTQGGPKKGLEMYRKVSNLRILACGGDGTVGWVLDVLDKINFVPPPAVGVLPLGTGNDLARSLGWGGGYTDEPVSKILCSIGEGDVCMLDRWQVDVKKNEECPSDDPKGKDNLPLNVVNNYFSIGVDAHIALEFHEAREANPQKYNSRLRNKMFYGVTGGQDLIQRKWKDLSDYVTIECDDKDVTHIIKDLRVHAIVFLNITNYGSGTHPWNRGSGEQHFDDGIIEVIGLTTYQMPMLQAGGHGSTIAQCKTAKITTKRTIPMQVDGEACRVNPSHFTLRHLNKAHMVIKKKSTQRNQLDDLHLKIARINMKDYEQNHYDKAKLKSSAIFFSEITIFEDADLDRARRLIEEKGKEKGMILSYDWCFLDSCTAERFFRIDKAQEHLHYITDICIETIYILDPEASADQSTGGNIRGDVSVDNDLDHSERMAMVSDVVLHHDDHFTESQRTRSRERVINPDSYPTSQLLEKTSDNIIRAAKQGDLKNVKDLHIQGFSLLSIDDHGQTALHFAARHGHKDIVRYLIASAPPSILDLVDTTKRQTALHLAASNRRRTVCCMLVAAGASLSIEDSNGFTPRTLAQRSDDQELAAYLENQEQIKSMNCVDQETAV